MPADGKTLGEIALRGNNVMLGYYRDDEATQRAAPDGWFRTGDLGVMHPDRYVEIRDRAKDIILSGGENIPSLEVERALAAHCGGDGSRRRRRTGSEMGRGAALPMSP